MAQNTKIEWAQKSWNPLGAVAPFTGKKGWHCTHVAEGCRFCYAEAMNRRLGTGLEYTAQNRTQVDWYLKDLVLPLKWKEPQKIFTASMTDLFHEDVFSYWLDRIYAVMALSPQHTYQNLTKRSERRQKYLSDPAVQHRVERQIETLVSGGNAPAVAGIEWPLPNVWEGTSVAHDADMGQVQALIKTPAALRWVSYEPAIGPVDWYPWLGTGLRDQLPETHWDGQIEEVFTGLHWIVVGGESGAQARPFDLQWARDTITAGQKAQVPVFVKQLGSRPYQRVPDPFNEDPHQFLRLPYRSHGKGGNWDEWPEDLRVRQYPAERS